MLLECLSNTDATGMPEQYTDATGMPESGNLLQDLLSSALG